MYVHSGYLDNSRVDFKDHRSSWAVAGRTA